MEPIREYNPYSDCPRILIIKGVYNSASRIDINIDKYDNIAPIFN
ncbi:hypothetical protein GCM10008931_38300 [Oceanobacillus oncorhynchi subsp. oncorhynchi]